MRLAQLVEKIRSERKNAVDSQLKMVKDRMDIFPNEPAFKQAYEKLKEFEVAFNERTDLDIIHIDELKELKMRKGQTLS